MRFAWPVHTCSFPWLRLSFKRVRRRRGVDAYTSCTTTLMAPALFSCPVFSCPQARVVRQVSVGVKARVMGGVPLFTGEGGGMLFNTLGSSNVFSANDVSFIACSATGAGGGLKLITSASRNGSVLLTNSSFIGCTAGIHMIFVRFSESVIEPRVGGCCLNFRVWRWRHFHPSRQHNHQLVISILDKLLSYRCMPEIVWSSCFLF